MNLKWMVTKLEVFSWAILLVFLSPSMVFAGSNQNLVYQGRIVRPDGSVPNAGNVVFNLTVYSPAPGRCLLYSETQSINMTGSQGMFSLQLGAGIRNDGKSHSLSSIFINGSTMSGLTCSIGNSYTASATDDRDLIVTFTDAGSTVSLSPMPIKSVPFALQASQIDGWGLNNLVKVSDTPSPTTFSTTELAKVKGMSALGCAVNQVLKWNSSGWSCASDDTGSAPMDAGYGAASKGVVAFETDAATSGISVSSGVAKLSNTGVGAGTYGAQNAVPTLTVDAQGRLSNAVSVPIQISSNQISVSGGTLGQVLKWNGSAWLPDNDVGITSESDPTVQSFAKNAPSARFVTTGSVLELAASGVSAGTYGSGTQVPVVVVDSFGRVTGVTNTAITGASPVGAALNSAQFWVGDASNVAAAVSLSGDASLFNNGSLSINKLQGQTLTLVANPGAGALLTYNTTFSRWEALALPDCTASETLGFNAVSGNYECQAINNATNFTGSLAGDVAGTQGATTVSRLQGQALQISSLAARDTLVYNGSAWVNANIPSCAANQYLTFNGSYFCVTDSGAAGVVTSVDVAVPSFMSTSGGPITTSGTISLGLQNQNANLVFAGPASGGAAAPSFRSLASEDIPALDAAKISSGTLPVSRGGTGSGAALANNKVMVSSGGAIVEGEGFGSAKANNTYVVRDGSGGFAAGAVTVDSSILKGATSGSLTLQAPASVTSYALTFPSSLGSLGQVLMTDASGNLSWATPTGGTVTSVSSSNAYLSVANGTSSATLTLNVGTAANTVAAGDDARITGALQRSGGTMSGVLNMGGQDLDNVGNIRMDASKYLGMGQFAVDPATGGWGASEKGRTWFNTATNEIKYWDGGAIRTLGVSGSGLQSLNGLSANNQSFAVGTAGTDFAITSSGSVHTFNLPSASASNRGLLSSADFATFTNKLSSSSQFAGDVSGTVDAITVNRLRGTNVSVGSLASGEFLKYNGSAWVNQLLSSSDVTSGLGYTPVNRAGDTMSGALNMNNNDLTAVASMQLKGSTTGTLTLAAPLAVTSYTLRFPSAVGSAGQVLATDASGNLSWAAGSANSFVQDGNSFGVPAVLGTNDSNSLSFETAGSTRMTVSASGMVGIGTSSPNAQLEIAGSGVKKLILRDDQDGNAQQSIISFEGATDGAHGWVGFASTGDDDLSILAQGANGDLVLGAGNSLSKGLRIKGSSGNVGIGTNSPNTTLDINGAETMRGMAAPAVSPAGQGRIYFDSTANKYKVSQNGGAYTDLVPVPGGGALSSLTAATATNTIDSELFAQVWNWSTATTQTPMTINANALTTGGILRLASSSASVNSTNGLLSVANTGAGTTGLVFRAQSNSTAESGLSVLANGKVGIGTTEPAFKLSLGTTNSYDNKIGMSGAQVLFLPYQPELSGSIFFGNGGASSVWTTGNEGRYNTGVGVGALLFNTSGYSNTSVGFNTLRANTTGYSNVAIGDEVLLLNTTGADNSGVGDGALRSNSTGSENTAVGMGALYLSTTGMGNIAIGKNTLYLNKVGNYNVAIGRGALFRNDAKSYSTAVGYSSMANADNTTTGATTYNTAIGAYSLEGSLTWANNTGIKNTALGYAALQGMTAGSGNIGVGYNAGSVITTGSNNVVIGSDTGASIATSSNNILISDGAGNRRLTINSSGNVGVGTTAPSSMLDINGAETMRGMAAPAVSSAGQGRIYFDSTSNKYKVSQNGGAYVDLVSAGGGGGSLSSLTAATATNTIDSELFAQVWNWSTATTETPLTINANALTTGGILSLASSSASVNSTNGLLSVANTGAGTTGMVLRAQSNSTAGSGLSVLANGNVGIGTTAPQASLDVNGTIRAKVNDAGAATSFDWSAGNLQYTTAPCAGASWAFTNLLDGGTYTLIVKPSAAHTGSCTFAQAGLTFRFQPTNATPTGSTHVIYTFLRAGSDVYVSWIEGY